jgi:hypothetical protein
MLVSLFTLINLDDSLDQFTSHLDISIHLRPKAHLPSMTVHTNIRQHTYEIEVAKGILADWLITLK